MFSCSLLWAVIRMTCLDDLRFDDDELRLLI